MALFVEEGNRIGISRKDYNRITDGYVKKTLLVIESVTDIGELLSVITKEVRRIINNEKCSAILRIEANPYFLRMSDLSAIADAMEAGGISRFQNSIVFKSELPSKTAHIVLFLFHK